MTLCVGSAPCCLPPNSSCVPTPPASLTISSVSPVCADCDGDGVNDGINVVAGSLTDYNNNGEFDQCEGFMVASPARLPRDARRRNHADAGFRQPSLFHVAGHDRAGAERQRTGL